MKTLEELKAERKKYEDIIKEYQIKCQKIKNEIIGRTTDTTQKYIGKYLRAFKRYGNGLDYSIYLYVTSVETNYDDGWYLKGYCFVTYFSKDENRQIFRTESSLGINLPDIEKGYYELEELTKEQFYEARNKSLKNIMEEEYDI